MRHLANDRQAGGSLERAEPTRHQAGRVASVILAIGAAALLGWLAVELYVKVVTLD